MCEVNMKNIFLTLVLLFSVHATSAEKWPDQSIYQIDTKWKTTDNKPITLSSFAGEKVIIGMVYTKCPHACPMTISKIMGLEKEILKLGTKEKFKVVLASFDSERDTPKHLAEYVKSKKLDPNKWIFLSSGTDSTARELAVVLGINYKKLEDGEFSHSNIISLLDEKGSVIAKVESLNADIAPLVKPFKNKK